MSAAQILLLLLAVLAAVAVLAVRLQTPAAILLVPSDHRSGDDEAHKALIERHDEIEFILIDAERERINQLYRGGELQDEARRRIERELDLRHANLTNIRAKE